MTLRNPRIYFNRRADFPFVWSIDEGLGTEERVFKSIHLNFVWAEAVYQMEAGDGGPYGEDLLRPRAWVQIYGRVKLDDFDGTAVIAQPDIIDTEAVPRLQ